MPELSGYIGPNVQSGIFVSGQISFAPPEVNSSVSTLRDQLVVAGWSNPTLASGDKDGTFATGTLTALSFPAHDPSSSGSGVPDTSGGGSAGTFDGVTFRFYDPYARPPDPDPPTAGVVWVALSTTSLGTLETFLGLASSNTRWNFAMVSGDAIEATLSVTAQRTGPGGNIDAYSVSGSWAPNGSYLGGPGPLGGGWNLYSAAAPVTGDVMKLTVYEGDFGGPFPAFQVEMPSGSGNSLTYPLASLEYNYGLDPYQAAFRNLPGTSYPVGGDNFIAAALNVPGSMGPVTFDVSNVTNVSGSVPVVVTTSGQHGLTMQDRVKLSGIEGATNVNGAWWVAQIPSPTTLLVSADPLVFIFGSGSAYTSGGGVTAVNGGPLLSITAVRNDTADPVLITTSVAHNFEAGIFVDLGGIGGIPELAGVYSVGSVPSPTTFEIAIADPGILKGNGAEYTGGGTLTTGIFQAMIASGDFTGTFYDGGQSTAVAVQGVFGSFPLQQRMHADQSKTYATLATYTFAIHVPFTGLAPGDDSSSLDLDTTAAKPIILAPYVATRIAPGEEARLTGTLWDSYVETQNTPQGYGVEASYDSTSFMAWVVHTPALPSVNATLWLRAQNLS